MSIVSLVAAVWIGFASFFGGLFHHPEFPTAQMTASTTAQARQYAQGVNPGGVKLLAPSSTQPQSGSQTSSAQTTSSASATLAEGSAWRTSLPLGDSKYSTSAPKVGYIYLCHVQSGGGGAQGNPTWISGSVWYPEQKVSVQGSVSWPNATYSMTISGNERTIVSNGLPTDHPTGTFPISRSDPAYQFDANPNSIQAQQYDYSLPVSPTMLATPACIYGEVGIMNDGVPLFDGFDAEYRDAVAHETQDAWDAHPDESGVYHYHGFEDSVMQDTALSTVIGFAFDGYPITGAKLPDGNYLTTSNLDECHGLTSTITLDGKSVTTYHYVITQDFPYSVSCFRGKSYEPKPGGGVSGQQQGQGTQSTAGGSPPAPPQAAISACASLTSGRSCSFSAQQGSVAGTCETPPGQSQLACVPAH